MARRRLMGRPIMVIGANCRPVAMPPVRMREPSGSVRATIRTLRSDAPGLWSHQQAAPGYGAQQSPQWSQRGADPRSDPRGFEAGAPNAPGHAGPQAMPQYAHGAGSFERPYQEPDLGHGDWPPQQEMGGFGQDPYSQAQSGAELGFAQPEGGELDPAYGEEDADYEDDYAPRGRARS